MRAITSEAVNLKGTNKALHPPESDRLRWPNTRVDLGEGVLDYRFGFPVARPRNLLSIDNFSYRTNRHAHAAKTVR